MSNIAKAFVVGNLVRDPELKQLPSGTSVCELVVAANNTYKKGDGELVEEVSFLEVEVFGPQADACGRYLAKGRQVAVDGTLRQDRWELDDGSKRSKVRIVGQNVQFLGGKGEGTEKDRPQRAEVKEQDKEETLDDVLDDDLDGVPF